MAIQFSSGSYFPVHTRWSKPRKRNFEVRLIPGGDELGGTRSPGGQQAYFLKKRRPTTRPFSADWASDPQGFDYDLDNPPYVSPIKVAALTISDVDSDRSICEGDLFPMRPTLHMALVPPLSDKT